MKVIELRIVASKRVTPWPIKLLSHVRNPSPEDTRTSSVQNPAKPAY